MTSTFLVKIYIGIAIIQILYANNFTHILYAYFNKCYDEYCKGMRSQSYMRG
jgi:hypothetical protein